MMPPFALGLITTSIVYSGDGSATWTTLSHTADYRPKAASGEVCRHPTGSSRAPFWTRASWQLLLSF